MLRWVSYQRFGRLNICTVISFQRDLLNWVFRENLEKDLVINITNVCMSCFKAPERVDVKSTKSDKIKAVLDNTVPDFVIVNDTALRANIMHGLSLFAQCNDVIGCVHDIRCYLLYAKPVDLWTKRATYGFRILVDNEKRYVWFDVVCPVKTKDVYLKEVAGVLQVTFASSPYNVAQHREPDHPLIFTP